MNFQKSNFIIYYYDNSKDIYYALLKEQLQPSHMKKIYYIEMLVCVLG